jgi:hypothetical protein
MASAENIGITRVRAGWSFMLALDGARLMPRISITRAFRE